MHRLVIRMFIAALTVLPAHADCESDIRSFYEIGGVFDPATLTPQEHAVSWVAPDGTQTPGNTSRWENANRVVSDNGGQFLLSYDGRFYQGPGWDGPWEDMGYPASEDAIAVGRAMNEIVLANLADMTCHGDVDIDGRPARKFTYAYRAETAGGASWWQSDYVLFIDSATGDRIRTEEHGLIESWAETSDPKADVRVTSVTARPGYTVPNPPTVD